MSDTKVKEIPDELKQSPKEIQEYLAYLLNQYHNEGNLTLPLWIFDNEVRSNFDLLKRECAHDQATLRLHKDIAFRLDAIENAIESLQLDGIVLFGLPGVEHAMYSRRELNADRMVRSLICGEETETKQRLYYSKLASIKKLVNETIHDIQDYLEGGATILDFYEDSQEMNLDSYLHRVMGPTRSAMMKTGWRGRSREGGKELYDVFISHAGEDKRTMAMPLNERLSQHGVNCFLDIEDLRPGDLGWDSMEHAMKTATIGVIILSPRVCCEEMAYEGAGLLPEVTRGNGCGCCGSAGVLQIGEGELRREGSIGGRRDV